MISKRLLSLVKYVDANDKIIDIGCDHALLDIYLVNNGFVETIIVSDIHKKALNSGVENIKKEGLENKIFARLGNGLEVLDDEDDINAVIISGMGTNTILNILNSEYTNKLNRLIIQSNNDHYLLRSGICKLGFKIINEDFILDNGKYYVNIVFERGIENYTLSDLKYGPILKNKGKEYYEYVRNKFMEIYNNIPDDSVHKLEMKEKIKELDDLI